jgi:hypothetical protein
MRDRGWVRCPDCGEAVEVPGEDQISKPLFVAMCQCCGLEFDWRLSNQDFLREATLHWGEYLAPSESWNHDHCAMCWQKFMEADLPGVQHAGYVTYTEDDVWWICTQCVEDLREEMGWRIEIQDENPTELEE